MERSNPLGYGWCRDAADGIATVEYFDLPDRRGLRTQGPSSATSSRMTSRPEPGSGSRTRSSDGGQGASRGGIGATTSSNSLAMAQRSEFHPGPSASAGTDRLHAPRDALAIGMTDSADYYDARTGVMEDFVSQRAASRGFTAALSASVQIFTTNSTP